MIWYTLFGAHIDIFFHFSSPDAPSLFVLFEQIHVFQSFCSTYSFILGLRTRRHCLYSWVSSGWSLGGLWVASGRPLGGLWACWDTFTIRALSGDYPGTIRAIGWMFVDPTRCLGKRAESEKLSTSPSTSNKFNNVNAFLLHPQIDNLSMKTNGKRYRL